MVPGSRSQKRHMPLSITAGSIKGTRLRTYLRGNKQAMKRIKVRLQNVIRPAKKASRRASRRAAGGRSGDYTKYSGKFTVRLPKSLHQALVDRAEKEGVSLNLFVTNALSRTTAMAGRRR